MSSFGTQTALELREASGAFRWHRRFFDASPARGTFLRATRSEDLGSRLRGIARDGSTRPLSLPVTGSKHGAQRSFASHTSCGSASFCFATSGKTKLVHRPSPSMRLLHAFGKYRPLLGLIFSGTQPPPRALGETRALCGRNRGTWDAAPAIEACLHSRHIDRFARIGTRIGSLGWGSAAVGHRASGGARLRGYGRTFGAVIERRELVGRRTARCRANRRCTRKNEKTESGDFHGCSLSIQRPSAH